MADIHTTRQKPSVRPLGREILLLDALGPQLFPLESASAERMGLKAAGLVKLPREWVPDFFVVSSVCFETSVSPVVFAEWCASAIESCGFGDAPLIVRSSGVTETLDDRGRFVSETCDSTALAATLQRSALSVANRPGNVTLHWIVQEHVPTERKGHFSNERRLSYDSRDWVAEIELDGSHAGYTVPVAVRRWRDGEMVHTSALVCSSEPQISLLLKNVASWALAASKGQRMHCEWVWNGSRLYIVQADVAGASVGVDPVKMIPESVSDGDGDIGGLSVFQPADDQHFKLYAKLQNARLYTSLGYSMPTFYVLDDPETIACILRGTISRQLEDDLSELTRRPLIIRTDGRAIPSHQREMLPRSDELRNLADAKAWLLGGFRARIQESGLHAAMPCLVAHHFVWSVASAWARAEPDGRMVRIESLWGVPEGLYWFSHDTFEVDVETQLVTSRPRYKGTFVGSNVSGAWVPFQTRAPHDWRKSIRRKRWLMEIPETTRAIADREKYSAAVMWLVDTDSRVTGHKVLPWFHNRSELDGPPKAAPRHKLKTAHDVRIASAEDWLKLKGTVTSGEHVDRIVIMPEDPELIRNAKFAEEVAELASERNIVVELAGSILSHAYYVFRRKGVQVECVDLFGADTEVVEFNKLVRDKVPESIEQRGERADVVQLRGDALLAALRQKLIEEAFEVLDARGGHDLVGELADVEEVVRAICDALGVPLTDVESLRGAKQRKKGGFGRGLVLTKTSMPRTLAALMTDASGELFGRTYDDSVAPVTRTDDIPSGPPYKRPDLRTVDQQPEKIVSFQVKLNRVPAEKQVTRFTMPGVCEPIRGFALELRFCRTREVLKGSVQLRLEPTRLGIDVDGQLSLDFEGEDTKGR